MFESAFEGGNLCAAYYDKETLSYDLVMHSDTNTRGYN